MTTMRQTNVLHQLAKDEILEAIRAGVRDAFWQMITNNTQTPADDFYERVKNAIADAMPSQEAIEEAIRKGTHHALLPDHPDVIRCAIEDGTCMALK
jgi:hypothetical protein